MKKLSPERIAHLYAIMAWSDQYTFDQAINLVTTIKYEDLDSISYAETSIKAAVQGIKEKLLPIYETANQFEIYSTIIEILADIHDKWVAENAKKYNRGNEIKSNQYLFQHLPTALIGIDELSKDLMFLAPFLDSINIKTGEMELVNFGSYKPNDLMITAYNNYVENYKQTNNIFSLEELSAHISNCINGLYPALTSNSEINQNRIDYMRDRIDLLTNTVVKKSLMF